jgi:hypothetical protein
MDHEKELDELFPQMQEAFGDVAEMAVGTPDVPAGVPDTTDPLAGLAEMQEQLQDALKQMRGVLTGRIQPGDVGKEQPRQPWQMKPEEFVKESEYQAMINANYFDKEGNAIASSRETPVTNLPEFPVGSWKIDDTYVSNYGRHLEQLQELDPNNLVFRENNVETNNEGRGWDAERYKGWMDDGLQPPPISVVERDGGDLAITDGHRRASAAKQANQKIRAWVSPRAETGNVDYEGKPIYTGLTDRIAVRDAVKAGEEVPPENLTRPNYPDYFTDPVTPEMQQTQTKDPAHQWPFTPGIDTDPVLPGYQNQSLDQPLGVDWAASTMGGQTDELGSTLRDLIKAVEDLKDAMTDANKDKGPVAAKRFAKGGQ